ncbi:rCG39223 [Rattus norvegicus]|uniref:RCG39223 n=1 Tax=Rattus norvegicus TaxID=10116 RepID=A6KMG5_RAT|nr:rCG39223 [Rattus norvegicus]
MYLKPLPALGPSGDSGNLPVPWAPFCKPREVLATFHLLLTSAKSLPVLAQCVPLMTRSLEKVAALLASA